MLKSRQCCHYKIHNLLLLPIECENCSAPAEFHCAECENSYCEKCLKWRHDNAKRKHHRGVTRLCTKPQTGIWHKCTICILSMHGYTIDNIDCVTTLLIQVLDPEVWTVIRKRRRRDENDGDDADGPPDPRGSFKEHQKNLRRRARNTDPLVESWRNWQTKQLKVRTLHEYTHSSMGESFIYGVDREPLMCDVLQFA